MFEGVLTPSENMCHRFQQSHFGKCMQSRVTNFFLKIFLSWKLLLPMESGYAYPSKNITGVLIHLSHIKGGFIK